MDTSDEWIRSRTGIGARRFADPGTSTADLAVAAGRAALLAAEEPAAELVSLATTTPDRRCPGPAPEVAHRLGLGPVPAFDLAAVCSGFVYATAVADAFIRSGQYRSVLAFGAETYSTIIDPEDRESAVIFGDGAGAVLYRRGESAEPGAVHGVELGSDGGGADLIAIAAGGSRQPKVTADTPGDLRYFRMRGREVYRHAVHGMTASADAVLGRVGWSAERLDGFIGHQANQRILDAVADPARRARGKPLRQYPRGGQHGGRLDPTGARRRRRRPPRPGRRPYPAHRLRRRADLGLDRADLARRAPRRAASRPRTGRRRARRPTTPPPASSRTTGGTVPAITRPEAYQLVSTLLSAQFEVDPAAIEPDARLADLGLDSLAAVELFDVLEERTGVRLETDDADLALTVEELAARLVDEQGVSASVARGASVSVDQA